MAEVYITPSPSTGQDTGMGLVAAVIIFALVFLGVIAYANGWFSVNPVIVSPTPSTSNITLTTPATVQIPDTTTTQAPTFFPSQTPSTSTQSAPASSLD